MEEPPGYTRILTHSYEDTCLFCNKDTLPFCVPRSGFEDALLKIKTEVEGAISDGDKIEMPLLLAKINDIQKRSLRFNYHYDCRHAFSRARCNKKRESVATGSSRRGRPKLSASEPPPGI